MRKDLLGTVFGLMLFTGACQAPGQATNPDGSLTKQEYGRRFVTLYKDFNKSTSEGIKSSGMVLGAGQTSASTSLFGALVPGSVPTSANSPTPANPSASASAMPGASAGSAPPAQLKQQLEILKVTMKAAIQSATQLESKLKALKPPPELAEKHKDILEYFATTRDLAEAFVKDFEAGDLAAIAGQAARYKDKTARLMLLQPQVFAALFEFSIETYRQDRLVLQQGGILNRSDYLVKMRSLMSRLPSASGGPETIFSNALLPRAGEPVVPADGAKIDFKARLKQVKLSLEQALQELAKIHPPADFEPGHTSIYAYTRLQAEVMGKMADILPSQIDTVQQNPLELITSLFSDSTLLDKLNDLPIFMPKAQDALERIVTG